MIWSSTSNFPHRAKLIKNTIGISILVAVFIFSIIYGWPHKETIINDVPEPKTFKEIVFEEFGERHIMVYVSKCESGLSHYGDSGNVIRGIQNNQDVGGFQINEYYHLETAQELGIDIYTPEGNVEYAKLLFEQSGTQPWNWSRPCWSQYL